MDNAPPSTDSDDPGSLKHTKSRKRKKSWLVPILGTLVFAVGAGGIVYVLTNYYDELAGAFADDEDPQPNGQSDVVTGGNLVVPENDSDSDDSGSNDTDSNGPDNDSSADNDSDSVNDKPR